MDGLRGSDDFGGAGERFCDSVVGVDLRYDGDTSREDGDNSETGGDLLQAGDLHGNLLHAREARTVGGRGATAAGCPLLGFRCLGFFFGLLLLGLAFGTGRLRWLCRLLALLFRLLFLSRFRIGKEAGGFHLVDGNVLVGLLRGIIRKVRGLMVSGFHFWLECGGILRRKRGSRIGRRLAIRIHGRRGLVVDRMRLGCRCSRDICRRLIGRGVLRCRCLRVLRNRLLSLLGNRIGRRCGICRHSRNLRLIARCGSRDRCLLGHARLAGGLRCGRLGRLSLCSLRVLHRLVGCGVEIRDQGSCIACRKLA